MGKISKAVIITGIALILIAFIVSLSYLEFDISQKISKLEDLNKMYLQKREELSREMASLSQINQSLTARLALEKDKAEKQKILSDLEKLSAEKQLSLLNEQTRLDAIKKQQAIDAAKIAAQKTSSQPAQPKVVTRAS